MMQQNTLLRKLVKPVFDGLTENPGGNDNDIFNPEIWVAEALVQISEARVVSKLAWTKASKEVARFGQIVHLNRPVNMKASRKKDGQNVKTSAVSSEGVDIKLNQWVHQSFVVYDAEDSVSFQDLVDTYIIPAAQSVAQMVDEIAATTLGETGGDALSMSMNLGYLLSTLIFALVFAVAVATQIKSDSFRPFLYWTTIVATTTVGTTLADFADRSLGIGYAGGSALLFQRGFGAGGNAANAGAAEAWLVALLSLINSTPLCSRTTSIRCGKPRKLSSAGRHCWALKPSSSTSAIAAAMFSRLCGPCNAGARSWISASGGLSTHTTRPSARRPASAALTALVGASPQPKTANCPALCIANRRPFENA